MIYLHIYTSQTAELFAVLISGHHLTPLSAYCTGMPAVILHELVSLFFFFFFSPNGKYQFGIGDLISLLSCISSGSDVSAESDHFKLNSKGSSGDMSALCSSSPSLKEKVFPMLVFFFSCKYMTAVDLWGRLE